MFLTVNDSRSFVTQAAHRIGNQFYFNPALKVARSFVGSLFVPLSASKIPDPLLTPDLMMKPKDRGLTHEDNMTLMGFGAATVGTISLISNLASAILPSIFGIPFDGILAVTEIVGLASLHGNKPRNQVERPLLRKKVGVKMADIASAVNKMLTSDHEKNLSDTIKSTITSRSHNWLQKLPKEIQPRFKNLMVSLPNLSEELIHYLKQVTQDPEITLLQVSSNLQDQINSTSPKELLNTFQEIVDFFGTYNRARESLEGKVFSNSLEERKAWANAMGSKWHKAFPAGTNDPVTLHMAFNEYMEEVMDKLVYILIPAENQIDTAVFQTVEGELARTRFDDAIKPALKKEIAQVISVIENPHFLLRELFKILERGISFIERELNIQLLSSPDRDNLFLTESVNQRTIVRAFSRKAHDCGITVGMDLTEAQVLYQEHYPQETIETKPALQPFLPNQILVDQFGGMPIVRDCSLAANKMGIYKGMNAIDAQILYNSKISAEFPVAEMISRQDPQNGSLFEGRLTLESLCSKVTTLIIEHGHEKVFKMLRESASHIPLGNFICGLFSILWTATWPMRKITIVSLRYLASIPNTEIIAEQITQRALMHLHSPAFKMLFFNWLDRFLDILVMHKNQMITPLEGQSGANVGSRDALLGDIILALLKTAAYDAAPLTGIYTNISKSRILSCVSTVVFWSTRKMIKINIMILDSKVNRLYLTHVIKKAIFLALERFKGEEFVEESRIFIDHGFDVLQQGIHIANLGKGFRLTLQAEISMIYRKAAELQVVDPNQKLLDVPNQDWGQMIHGIVTQVIRTGLLHTQDNSKIFFSMKEMEKYKITVADRKKSLPAQVAKAKEAVEKFSLAIQSLDDGQIHTTRMNLEQVLRPIKEISLHFEAFIPVLKEEQKQFLARQNFLRLEHTQTMTPH